MGQLSSEGLRGKRSIRNVDAHLVYRCASELVSIPNSPSYTVRRNRSVMLSRRFIKRSLDFSLATAGGVMLLPICAILALLIKLEDGGPILYAQMRTGKGG